MGKVVFLVPYRGRPQQREFFERYMTWILKAEGEAEGEAHEEIFFVHQCDTRSFNRGAMKNIGFLAYRAAHPDDYLDVTFVFNDVDTVPYKRIFEYATTTGTVKHFYGFRYALGGIVAMTGADIERVNGFPNYWGWGHEDTALQTRCLRAGLSIDRSFFHPIGHPNILHLFDGVHRIINRLDPWREATDDGRDGVSSIHALVYDTEKKEINVRAFETAVPFVPDAHHAYDLRAPPRPVLSPAAEAWSRRSAAPSANARNERAPHPYSHEYASFVRAPVRAAASVRIQMGRGPSAL